MKIVPNFRVSILGFSPVKEGRSLSPHDFENRGFASGANARETHARLAAVAFSIEIGRAFFKSEKMGSMGVIEGHL
jgi:hypothetical protein